jgi:hypothetical protein
MVTRRLWDVKGLEAFILLTEFLLFLKLDRDKYMRVSPKCSRTIIVKKTLVDIHFGEDAH